MKVRYITLPLIQEFTWHVKTRALALWLAFRVPIALGLARITQGTGVVENDLERNIYIPD